MQTFLYVLGPFLLMAGIGLGALYAAFGWVRNVTLPKKRQAEAEELASREVHEFACQAQEFLNVLMVKDAVKHDVELDERLVSLYTTALNTGIRRADTQSLKQLRSR